MMLIFPQRTWCFGPLPHSIGNIDQVRAGAGVFAA